MSGEHYDREAILEEDRQTREAIWNSVEKFSRFVPRERPGKDSYRDGSQAPRLDRFTNVEEFDAWLDSLHRPKSR